MTISWIQAALLGLFASLSSMPGMGGSSIGNYTLGRPLVGGLVCGLILGDVQLGIICGVAVQVAYIALVTPGGTVSADVRAVSYIGIPLAMAASQTLVQGAGGIAKFAVAMGSLVGTLGTVLFYGTATLNLVWQHIGWEAVKKKDFKRLYTVNWGLPWISHFAFSFIPTLILTKYGSEAVDSLKAALPMSGIPMRTLFTIGALLPCVGIAILLKQIVEKATDFIPFFVGFTLAASLGLNLVACAVISLIFAVLFYEIQMAKNVRAQAASGADFDDDDEEDI